MKRLLNPIIILIILVIIILLTQKLPQFNKDSKISPTPTSQIKSILDAPKSELENYYAIYKDPYILYLRKCLDAYVAHDSSGVNISMAAVESSSVSGFLSGLDSFSKDYYKSKFVVVTLRDSIAGGKDIQIIFQDKPDKIFYVWIYKLADDSFELRGFNVNGKIDQKALKAVVDYYGPLLFDKNHAL